MPTKAQLDEALVEIKASLAHQKAEVQRHLAHNSTLTKEISRLENDLLTYRVLAESLSQAVTNLTAILKDTTHER